VTEKGIGINRMILLPWLDRAAEARLRNNDPMAMRQELDTALSPEIGGNETRRKVIDYLVNIWQKNSSDAPFLLEQALDLYPRIPMGERIWLHYGLTLSTYPFFRQCAALFGQYARIGETVPVKVIKERMATDMGQMGSLQRSARYVVASMSRWEVLEYNAKGHLYTPKTQALKTDNCNLEVWLLSCGLYAHPAEELTFIDLLRLPELFPFKFTLTLDTLRNDSRLIVQRQGSWDMVRLNL
jgi:hypothetical protein